LQGGGGGAMLICRELGCDRGNECIGDMHHSHGRHLSLSGYIMTS